MKANLLTKLTATASALFLLGVSAPARAASFFGTDKIQFDSDTEIQFNFNQSHGAYTSILKVFEVGANNLLTEVSPVQGILAETKGSDNWGDNGWLGTLGNTVAVGTNSFVFQAGKQYTLGLSSTLSWEPSFSNTVYSTTALNPFGTGGSQQFLFGSWGSTGTDGTQFDPTPFQSGNPFAGPVKIGIDDRGNGNDKDFQDFTLTAVATTIPEPATLGAIGAAIGGLALSRRRRRQVF